MKILSLICRGVCACAGVCPHMCGNARKNRQENGKSPNPYILRYHIQLRIAYRELYNFKGLEARRSFI